MQNSVGIMKGQGCHSHAGRSQGDGNVQGERLEGWVGVRSGVTVGDDGQWTYAAEQRSGEQREQCSHVEGR